MQGGFIGKHRFRRQLFQHFDTALRLFCLVGFVTETIDERLQMFARFFGFRGLFQFVFPL